MMETPVISVRSISKKYFIGTGDNGKPKRALMRFLTLPYRMVRNPASLFESNGGKGFWALKDINFDVYHGERIGIIGRNGAGKSTLLKILSRLVYPTEGEVRIKGRVTSLLGIGTGFNANLTGKENIYLNASMYGLTKKEINEKYDMIVDFSELKHEFINTPVKYYSSGMYMRLAFAVAAHLEPDILMLDEVLAVGDMKFSQKCLRKVDNMTGKGQTLLFVSHSMGNILKFCDKIIWLDEGKIKYFGDVVDGVQLYQDNMAPAANEVSLEHRSERKGSGLAQISKIGLYDKDMNPVTSAIAGEDIIIVLHYRCDPAFLQSGPKTLACSLYVENEQAQRLFGMPNHILKNYREISIASEGKLIWTIKNLPLLPGHYNLSYTVTVDNDNADKLFQSRGLVVLDGDFYGSGKTQHPNMGAVCIDFDFEHQTP
jgi:lipopolysaccharide transport system ATP-binding protein